MTDPKTSKGCIQSSKICIGVISSKRKMVDKNQLRSKRRHEEALNEVFTIFFPGNVSLTHAACLRMTCTMKQKHHPTKIVSQSTMHTSVKIYHPDLAIDIPNGKHGRAGDSRESHLCNFPRADSLQNSLCTILLTV